MSNVHYGWDPRRFEVDVEAFEKLAEPRAAEHLARFAKGEPPAWPYDGSARRARWWRKAWDMSHLHRTTCSGCGRIGWTGNGQHHMTSEEVGACSCGRTDWIIRCPPGCGLDPAVNESTKEK